MDRDLILGTAGHIDHGKTALVKSLTGIDCDRLPEEKARGITIDLGFASLELAGRRVGVVDVPGHERFVRNMLAGASGIDLILLAVAADDGIMPQTLEHFEIATLLGIRHGVVAVTKADLADAPRRAAVAADIRRLLAGTPLAEAPVVFTSARSGEGIPELREELRAAAERCAARETPESPFRLAIDRAFTRPGFGTVVTGSVASGRARVGDELEWWPTGRRVRVRALHQHDRAVDEVHRGMRAAINLAGAELAECHRGQTLAAPGYLRSSRTLSVRVRCSAISPRPLKRRLPVRLHLGTAEIMATLSLLEPPTLAPGESGLGQLFLDDPATAVWGQPFVVRDSSAEATLGGGTVLQAVSRKIRRSDGAAQARLAELESPDPARRLLAAAAFAGPAGLAPDDAPRDAGLTDARPVMEGLETAGELVRLAGRWLAGSTVAELEDRVLAAVGRLHDEQPLVALHDRAKALARLEYLKADAVLAEVVTRLVGQKRLLANGPRIARADFRPRLSAQQQKVLTAILEGCAATPFAPPELSAFLKLAGGNAGMLREIAATATAAGLLVRISDEIHLTPAAAADLRDRVVTALRQSPGGLTVSAVRDLLGTTRKYAVPFCEYLDRVGVTRRQGDFRVLAQDRNATSE
jgi:selenocysteine-specific elongation factor